MSPTRGTTLRIDPSVSPAGATVSPLLFGHNLEHTRRCVWGGLSAELVRNRKLVGECGPRGVATDWYPIGPETCLYYLESTLDAYTAHEGVDLADRYTCDFSVQRQMIQNCTPGQRCGMGQGDIALPAKGEYRGLLAVQVDRPIVVRVQVSDDGRRKHYFAKSYKLRPGGWREIKFAFPTPAADERTRLEVTFDQAGTLYVGAASLVPADNFRGLRTDAIERLREISVPLLRWPGGNFAGDYRWKDGLLPVHRRAGLKAFYDQTLRYTNNYDTHEIGTDDYIALCRRLGAEPFITINISLEGPQDAADWVEYCNGSPRSRWGKVRAARGHREPYGVKYWSLGNEAGYSHMKGPNRCEDYCQFARKCSTAMRAVDPSITLVASGTWYPSWANQVPPKSYRDYEHVSFHWYVQPGVKDFLGKGLKKDLLRIARMPDTDRDRVRQTREAIDARRPKGRPIGIAYDEWNMWYAWNRRPLAVDAVYAAGFLHMLCRSAKPLGITMAAFFEPVNEGAILVGPADSELSTMGEVFALLKVHQGGRLLDVPYSPEGDVDALATASPDGTTIHVTLVNRRPDRAARVTLDLGGRARAVDGQLVQLAPADAMSPAVRLVRQTRRVGATKNGQAVLDLPAFSISRMDIPI